MKKIFLYLNLTLFLSVYFIVSSQDHLRDIFTTTLSQKIGCPTGATGATGPRGPKGPRGATGPCHCHSSLAKAYASRTIDTFQKATGFVNFNVPIIPDANIRYENSAFLINISGIYQITYSLIIKNPGATDLINANLLKNNNSISVGATIQKVPGDSGTTEISFSFILNLDVDDSIKVFSQNSNMIITAATITIMQIS